MTNGTKTRLQHLVEEVEEKITHLSNKAQIVANDFLEATYTIEDGVAAQLEWLEEISLGIDDILIEEQGGASLPC